MNYLVHLYLSGPIPLHRLGGMMGDFVKGPIPGHYPEQIRTGLRHHRRIDHLAHISPFTRQSRQRLGQQFGHARGILVDIFYDHFMANHWEEFSDVPLASFAAETYDLLHRHDSILPEGLRTIVPRMTAHNWLVSYRDEAAVETALDRISMRLSRPLPLAEGIADLRRHRARLETDFRGFLQQAVELGRNEFGISSGPHGRGAVHMPQ